MGDFPNGRAMVLIPPGYIQAAEDDDAAVLKMLPRVVLQTIYPIDSLYASSEGLPKIHEQSHASDYAVYQPEPPPSCPCLA